MATAVVPTNELDSSILQKDTNPFLCSFCGEKEEVSKPLVKCEGCKHHLHLPCGGFNGKVSDHVLFSLYWSWRCQQCFNRDNISLPSDNGGQERESFFLTALQQMEDRLLARMDDISISLADVVARKNGAEQVSLGIDDNRSSRDQSRKASAGAPGSFNVSASCDAGAAQSVEAPSTSISCCASDTEMPGVNTISDNITDSSTVRKLSKKIRTRRKKKKNAHPQSSGSTATASSIVTPQIDAVGTAVLNSIKATFASVLSSDKSWEKANGDRANQENQDVTIVGTRQRSMTQLRAINKEYSAGDIFVTRLVPDTTSECVRRHILDSTGFRVVVNKLRTRHDSYASFRVSSQGNIHSLLSPAMWPKGVLVQKYRGRSEHSPNILPKGSRRQ